MTTSTALFEGRSRYYKEDTKVVSKVCKIMEEIFAEGFAEGFVEGYAEGYAKTVGEDLEEGYEELRAKLARPIAVRLVERRISVDSIALAVDRSVPTVEGWIKESGALAC